MRCFCVLAGVPDPWCEKWETLYVTRVELTDTATVLSIVACGMEHEDDYYVLIPWNQWARRSFRHIELDKKERGIMVSPFSCLFLLV